MLRDEMHVALVGNLSDGYTAYGPYSSFDVAASNTEGLQHPSWIMSLVRPILDHDQMNAAARERRILQQALRYLQANLDDYRELMLEDDEDGRRAAEIPTELELNDLLDELDDLDAPADEETD